MPTPNIEPINVCELEQGIPRYHVPRFQIIAVNNNANIIASPWYIFWSTKASVGNKFTIPIATAIPPTNTPVKFNTPDNITATDGFNV